MSEIKVNKLTPRTACGTTTLGDSGDTINIPAGVTISNNGTATGFGATGAVNWDVASIKTTDFTATSGVGYFVDTATTGAVIVTLPAAPAVGDVVGVSDYAQNFSNASCTLNPNSLKVGGIAANVTLSTEGLAVTLVYVDVTKGWIVTDSGLASDAPGPKYIAATGGCITTCGNYKIHTFNSPGTLCVSCLGNSAGSNTVDYLVVAGAGGGGAGYYGGGGGAGGFRFYANTTCNAQPGSNPGAPVNGYPSGTAATVSAGAMPIIVGGGGAGGPGSSPGGPDGANGVDSSFSNITSTGGGGGDSRYDPPHAGNPGGSGGGGGACNSGAAGGSGNTPPVSPPQGKDGGTYYGGGGGGALVAGGSRPGTPYGGDGGAGAGVTGFGTGNGQCSSSVQYFSGGGGGGADKTSPAPNTPTGGIGGGGQGQGGPGPSPAARLDGTTNTGGGGGGGGENYASGANGGSGIVVIRYKYQ